MEKLFLFSSFFFFFSFAVDFVVAPLGDGFLFGQFLIKRSGRRVIDWRCRLFCRLEANQKEKSFFFFFFFRVALVFPNNDAIGFICAFYGCLHAGVVPVPIEVPLTRRDAGSQQIGKKWKKSARGMCNWLVAAESGSEPSKPQTLTAAAAVTASAFLSFVPLRVRSPILRAPRPSSS